MSKTFSEMFDELQIVLDEMHSEQVTCYYNPNDLSDEHIKEIKKIGMVSDVVPTEYVESGKIIIMQNKFAKPANALLLDDLI